MKHYPMTKEQRETLDHDLATLVTGLSDVATLLGACFGVSLRKANQDLIG